MKSTKKILSLVCALALVFSLSISAMAVPAQSGTVSVSITYGNFNSNGAYTGNGFTNANFSMDSIPLDISEVQDLVDGGLKGLYYLPNGVTDPVGENASVMDAIITAFLYNGYDNISAGWDSYSAVNGGYISNVVPQTVTTNPVTYYEGPNGNMWGNATGTGWNVAYTQNGVIQSAPQYASNIQLTDGMEIIFDISPYNMSWDTGMPWTK